MGKIIKPGKIVIVLNGRFAGRKAVVVKAFDDGTKDRKFGHALIAGIERAPRKLTKSMGEKKIARRSRVKPFVKFVNVNHIMPTRYNIDAAIADKLKTTVDEGKVASVDGVAPAAKKDVLKAVKTTFETRFKEMGEPKGDKVTSGALYFFRKLRF